MTPGHCFSRGFSRRLSHGLSRGFSCRFSRGFARRATIVAPLVAWAIATAGCGQPAPAPASPPAQAPASASAPSSASASASSAAASPASASAPAPASGSASASSSQAGAPATAPETEAIELSEEARRSGGLTVEPVRTVSRTRQLAAPARLQVDETRTARLGSTVDGVVVDVRAQVGSRVTAGALLASIHSHLVHDAWAGHRKALAEQRREATELAFAKEAEGRAQRLLAAKALSRQEAERAHADLKRAEEALSIADSEVTRALEELEHLGLGGDAAALRKPADKVPVRAPHAGVVLERAITPGSAVTAGAPLFVISDLSHLWVVAEVDEAHLPELSVGRSASVEVTAYPGERFTARIAAIGDTVDPETRRVTVRAQIANRDGRLKPQMYASVQLGTGEPRDVLVVPSSAVQALDNGTIVFVQDAQGRFHRRTVVVGADEDGRTEVRDGLRAGERVVANGAFLLKSTLVGRGQPE